MGWCLTVEKGSRKRKRVCLRARLTDVRQNSLVFLSFGCAVEPDEHAGSSRDQGLTMTWLQLVCSLAHRHCPQDIEYEGRRRGVVTEGDLISANEMVMNCQLGLEQLTEEMLLRKVKDPA